jgi:hypothetical protein
MIATYDGTIKWQDHSTSSPFGDDDYNFGLFRGDNAGLTNAGDGLGLEFQAKETIDNFNTGWWARFHQSVDGTNGVDPHSLTDNRYAIVTGLFGIDGIHGGWSELHPVYMLAIRVASTDLPGGAVEERWVFFMRNWGNEGMCSHDQHYFGSTQGDGSYFVQFPWRSGAERVEVETGKTVVMANFPSVQISYEQTKGQWLYLRAVLPDGSSEPLVHGEIVLKWSPSVNGKLQPLTSPPANTFPALAHAAEVLNTRGLERIMDPVQRQAVATLLNRGETANVAAPQSLTVVSPVDATIAEHRVLPIDPRMVLPHKDVHKEDSRKRAEHDATLHDLEAQFGPAGANLRIAPQNEPPP